MAGLQVLMKGGNAIDAAVAVGATLNMMEPQMNGVGGNGFMTIYEKKSGKVYSLGMTGAAPLALKASEMTPEKLDFGINAGGVPGNYGGYLTALQRFGTRSLAEVSRPRHRLRARLPHRSIAGRRHRPQSREAPGIPTTAKVFLPGGRPPTAGELFRIPTSPRPSRKPSKPSRPHAGVASPEPMPSRLPSTASTRATLPRNSIASSATTKAT